MPQSAELAGGAGFTYEDDAAAYYLAAILSEGDAPGIEDRTVVAVAVQQRDFGEPLDDMIVDFADRNGELARLSLQVKQRLTISDASSNSDFREIIRACRETLAKSDFRLGVDRYGAAVGTITASKFRAVNELAELARASTNPSDFEKRFGPTGNAPAAVKLVWRDLVALTEEMNGTRCKVAICGSVTSAHPL